MSRNFFAPCFVAVLSAGFLCASANAQSSGKAAAEAGFYVGAGFGASKLDLKRADFGPVNGTQANLDQSDRAGKVFAGYRFNPYFSIEGQYLDFGKATAKYALTGGAAKEDYRLHAASIAAVGSLPISDSVSLFAKLGPAATTVKSTVSAAALGAGGTAKRTVLLAGIGATYQVTENVHLRAEYERLGEVGKAGTPGRAKPSAFTLGVGYRF